MRIETKPLIEFGQPVEMPFRDTTVAAQRDTQSGYVFFPAPNAEELVEFYQAAYAEKQGSEYYQIETDYESQKNIYHANRMLMRLRSIYGREPKSAIELGCAYGGLTAEMRRWGIDVTGYDLGERSIEQGRKIKGNDRIFKASNLDALTLARDKVELIYTLHALEHDPSFVEVIGKCRDVLTDDGLVFVSVPNAMFANAVLGGFRKNWWVAYPDHLHMLSPGFLPTLCDATGFEPIYWDTSIFFDVDPTFVEHFSLGSLAEPRKRIWEKLLGTAGHGMELNFVLAPSGGVVARRLAATIRQIRLSLEAMCRREVEIRDFMEAAQSPFGAPLPSSHSAS